jgi:peroxiredoxin 5
MFSRQTPNPIRRITTPNLIQPITKPKHFLSTPATMVKTGDSIPTVELVEDSPGNTVNLAKELAGSNGLIIGVPAAFSMWSVLQAS